MRAEYRKSATAGRLLVFNQARTGSTTGPLKGTNMLLNAVVVDEDAGKLKVGPSFIPSLLYGPYWVAALADDYSWAVISGGPPTKASNGACTNVASGPGALFGNGEGLWLFHRSPNPSGAMLAEMRAAAAQKGFDISLLQSVDQTGCEYAPFPAQ